MTRQEFINDIDDIYELYDFCIDYDLHLPDNIYTYDEMTQDIDDDLVQWARNCSGWQDLEAMLDDIPENPHLLYMKCDYTACGFIEYDDEYFDTDKNDILRQIDDYYPDIWDDYVYVADKCEADSEHDEDIDYRSFFAECREESLKFVNRDGSTN